MRDGIATFIRDMNQHRTSSRTTMMIALGVLALATMAGLVSLGMWQIERLAWKTALIARVEARVHAAPIAPPGPASWPHLTSRNAEYLHIRLTGRYLPGRDTLVAAATEQGPGWWVMTPFVDAHGFVVLVNRGFIAKRRAVMPSGHAEVVGLLRSSELQGSFLRHNAPTADRWYSRDVAGIARQRGLSRIAPYYIDADRDPQDRTGPIGGLTVLQFSNNHLVYAGTWFALAAIVAALLAALVRAELRRRPMR